MECTNTSHRVPSNVHKQRLNTRLRHSVLVTWSVCILSFAYLTPWVLSSRLHFVSAFVLAGKGPPAPPMLATGRKALQVNEDEYIEVWDQTVDELLLDVRELLITDANVYFVGPDVDSYADSIGSIADGLNYTSVPFRYADTQKATQDMSHLERIYSVPPLISVQRWPWAVMMQGLVVWIDGDGWEKLDALAREKRHMLKYPKKKDPFGPMKPRRLSIYAPSENPLSDPIDMWQEADVHVDIQKHPDVPVTKLILASIINTILDNPPKWRGWMRQAKTKGTIGADYQTPFEERRSFHSNGVSPRLNRLLTE